KIVYLTWSRDEFVNPTENMIFFSAPPRPRRDQTQDVKIEKLHYQLLWLVVAKESHYVTVETE
uniref:Uncharacterized protein n=1 Tax=Peromyscus maniculatus bairdii TaxID=230844 RepID=A0A8C8UMI5_PERMB